MAKKFDIIVVGAGPSGITAAIYALREGLKVLLIDKEGIGGKLNIIPSIQNYPGYKDVSGIQLATNMIEQLTELKATIVLSSIISISKKNTDFTLKTESEAFVSKAVILATGTRDKKLGVPGEQKFLGRGVSYCSLCDGHFFRNKPVVVIGGGDRAYSEAYHLTSLCSHVYLIQRRAEARADKSNIKKLQDCSNATIIKEANIVSIIGDTRVRSVVYKVGSSEYTLEISGVFPLVGSLPNTELVNRFTVLDANNYVKVDSNYQTEIDGLFACGDVVSKTIRQIATSVGDGAIAATMASRYVKGFIK